MTIGYVGLGSNLNSPKRQLYLAHQALKQLPQTRVMAISGLHQSKAAGVVGQPDYYNAVIKLKTHLPAHALLRHCQRIEKQQKRVRKKRWGARTLDLDLLLFGQTSMHTPDLILPHPRLHLRDFMLIPLLELWPEAHFPDGTLLTTCLSDLKQYIL